MGDLDAIFKSYDIRGLYPSEIDGDTCQTIGSAFARFLSEEDPEISRIVVGIDIRSSSEELSTRFIQGVVASGIDVCFLGLSSTDMLYFASGILGAPGAIFTASHNPAEYNGIKLCRPYAVPIGEGSGLGQIKSICISNKPTNGNDKGTVTELNLLGDFTEHVLSFIDPNKISDIRIVADTANGMGGLIVPAIFQNLRAEIEILYGDLDGNFPNHPADPLNPENLKDLTKRVLETSADVGLAFDGDADRVFLIDETGTPLSGSITTAIVAKSILESQPNATIIHNLICSRSVKETITTTGGHAIRSRVGHSHIKQLMATSNAEFAGEHSGHYYFKKNFRADSGIIAALIVLEYMSDQEVNLSQLREKYDIYSSSGELNFAIKNPSELLEIVEQEFINEQSDSLDGLTITSDTWWFNLRPSNTEPLVRLNLEADNDTIREQMLVRLKGLIDTYSSDHGN